MLLLLLLLLLLSRFSHVQLSVTPQTAAHQAPPSLRFSRQEHWSGLPLPSPMHKSEKWKWSHSVMSDPQRPHGLQPTRLLQPWDFLGKSTGVGCHCLLRNMLSRLVITFLPRSKRLLISWLQSPPAVILEPEKIKSDTVSTGSPSTSHEVMGPDAMVLVLHWSKSTLMKIHTDEWMLLLVISLVLLPSNILEELNSFAGIFIFWSEKWTDLLTLWTLYSYWLSFS